MTTVLVFFFRAFSVQAAASTPCRLMGTLTVQPRFPGQLTIQPRFPGTLTVK